MKNSNLPSKETLEVLLDYNPITGDLTWKARDPCLFAGTEKRTPEHLAKVWNSTWAGKPALASKAKNGYLRGTVDSVFYYAHRVIFKMVAGEDPDKIDHINGIRSDNRWENLRSVSITENLRNRQLSRNNTSGIHGVSFNKRLNLWSATIYDNNKPNHLGWYKDFNAAVDARLQAEEDLNYHPNHGRKAQNQPNKPVKAK